MRRLFDGWREVYLVEEPSELQSRPSKVEKVQEKRTSLNYR